jgi:ribosomal protein S30
LKNQKPALTCKEKKTCILKNLHFKNQKPALTCKEKKTCTSKIKNLH